MKVESSFRPTTLSFSHMVKARYSGGRISLPVSSGDALYAHFKHISGIPSGSDGYPVSRLRAIDNLIEALKLMKGERAYAKDVTGLSRDDMDVLMGQYLEEMGRALSAPAGRGVQLSALVVDAVT